MRITEFQIDRYGPLPRLRETCDGGITVVHGPNESGKTLLLESVLKLLDPAVEQVYPGIDRVDESPSGYVVVEIGDGEEKLGDGTALSEIAPIDPTHLRNLFTVRDSDLSLHDQHAFYDSLTERIGDLHTSEIEAIQEEFEQRGRLTPTTRNLSSAAGADHAKDVRTQADRLATRIAEYIEEAEAERLDETERQLLGVNRELRACREELELQQRARTVAEHQRLSDRLDAFRDATDALADRYEYTRDELDRLTALGHRIETATASIEAATEEIESLERDIDRTEVRLADHRSEREALSDRAADVDEIEAQLDAVRERRASTTGSDRWMQTTGRLAVVGVALGGVAGIAGAITGSSGASLLGLLVLFVGLGSALAWGYSHRQLATIESRRSGLLEAARDAGFDVESVPEIAPAIRTFRTNLAAAESRVAELQREIDVAAQLLEQQEATIETATDDREEARAERREILDRAEVDDVDAYRRALEATDTLERRRASAEQSLRDALGEPPSADAEPDVQVEHWSTELASMVDALDVEAIDPDEYDEARLAALMDRTAELDAQASTLDAQLADHRQTIQQFEEAAQDIRAEPFVDAPLRLQAATIDGLDRLQAALASLVERIERDAEISRVGLEIFDEIHDAEEEKITDLFDGQSRATSIFSEITRGRYVDVAYDPEDRELRVEDTTGAMFTPAELSHGTREQLYFATRASLSEQLLGTEPGFFILDDAFLPADRTRLEDGFEVLQSLTDDGWQIIYLTAKHEVGVELVDSLDLSCIELDPLP